MASAFGHALAAFTVGQIGTSKKMPKAFWFGMILLSIFPDVDSALRIFGVTRDACWGHRGFTHSVVFALGVSFLYGLLFLRKLPKKNFANAVSLLFLAMFSHSVLDALTTGGSGIAFFWPLNCERYFFPWRVIEVSPISISRFFTERGLQIIKSEALWIGIPCAVLLLLKKSIGRRF